MQTITSSPQVKTKKKNRKTEAIELNRAITGEILSDDAEDTIAGLIAAWFEAEEVKGFKVGEI